MKPSSSVSVTQAAVGDNVSASDHSYISATNNVFSVSPGAQLTVDHVTVNTSASVHEIFYSSLNWPISSFSVPETIPRPLHSFYSSYQAAFQNTLLQQALTYYIEPDILPSPKASNIQRAGFRQFFESFLSSKTQSFLLLHGDAGSGKSLVVRQWQKELWDRFIAENTSFMPFVVELKQVKKETLNFLKEFIKLSPHNYSDEQIKILQREFHFLIFLDGLDECPDACLKVIQEDCAFHEWKAKVVLTARTEWLLSQEDYRYILTPNTKVVMPECFLAGFTFDQINHYINKYFIQSSMLVNNCRTVLNGDKEILALAASPIMLYIICQTLPSLIDLSIDSSIKTRTWLYQKFIAHWFEREIEKSHTLQIFPKNTHQNLARNFIKYSQKLAFEMYCKKKQLIERTFHKKEDLYWEVEEDIWINFFDSDDIKEQQAQRACPLSLERIENGITRIHRYQFIHKSFMEYSVSSFMWNSLNEKKLTDTIFIWNHRFLIEEIGVLAFLIERLLGEENSIRHKIEEQLLKMVYASRNDSSVEQAASSAITFLNKTGFNFSNKVPGRDLSYINISHADLTNANMAYINCSHSNLSGVNFHNAILAFADLSFSTLAGTTFFEEEEGYRHTYTLACHPQNPDILAYPNVRNIFVINFSNELVKRLKGHVKEVSSVAWSMNGALLASGSFDKTIRIWGTNNFGDYICLKILEGHKNTIMCVAWSVGWELASGSYDRTIIVWKIADHGQEIYRVLENNTETDCIAWSMDGKLLASGGWNNELHVWDIGDLERSPSFKVFHGHTGKITCVAWLIDGKLASGSDDETIRVWDLTRSEDIACITVSPELSKVCSITCSSDGKLAVGVVDGVAIWNENIFEKEMLLHFFQFNNRYGTIAWSQNNQWICALGKDAILRVSWPQGMSALVRRLQILNCANNVITEKVVFHPPSLPPLNKFIDYSDIVSLKNTTSITEAGLYQAFKTNISPYKKIMKASKCLSQVDKEKKLRNAAYLGDEVTLSVLLDLGTKINAAGPETGLTALHHAINGEWLEGIKILLLYGADPDQLDKNNQSARQLMFEKKAPNLEAIFNEVESHLSCK